VSVALEGATSAVSRAEDPMELIDTDVSLRLTLVTFTELRGLSHEAIKRLNRTKISNPDVRETVFIKIFL